MALIAGMALFLHLFPGQLLQFLNFRWGLVVSQVLFIAGPALLASRLFYLDRRAIFPLARPGLALVAGTVAGTLSLNHLLTVAGTWQERIFPVPPFYREALEELLRSRGPGDFIGLLVVFAVVPAVCEEILFRGFLQSGLVRAFQRPSAGIACTAAIFALFHLLPQLYPGTFVLGLFVGWLAQSSGTLIPAMLAHGLNNALSIAFDNAPDAVQQGLIDSPALAAAAVALLAASIVLLRRSMPPRNRVL
jgi:sodium transport system permease protein